MGHHDRYDCVITVDHGQDGVSLGKTVTTSAARLVCVRQGRRGHGETEERGEEVEGGRGEGGLLPSSVSKK